MQEPRIEHSETRISDRRILVIGGKTPEKPIKTVEIYEPSKKAWILHEHTYVRRRQHATVALNENRVCIIGGLSVTAPQ